MSDPDIQVVLVGPMAAGKTSVGRSVARLLRVPFRDSDKSIVSEHGPIPEIFAGHGEARFREIERETIAGLLEGDGVLSLGGGAVIDPATRARLSAVPVAFLTVSVQAVAPRITGGNRPLLADDEDPVERWSRIFRERRPWYEEVADETFDTSRLPMHRVAQNIATWLEEKNA